VGCPRVPRVEALGERHDIFQLFSGIVTASRSFALDLARGQAYHFLVRMCSAAAPSCEVDAGRKGTRNGAGGDCGRGAPCDAAWQRKAIHSGGRGGAWGLSAGERVPGTCEKIGFANLRTTYFHQLTLRVTDGNSIFSHVPDTLPPKVKSSKTESRADLVGYLSDLQQCPRSEILNIRNYLPQTLAALNGAVVLIAFAVDSTSALPSVLPLIVFKIDYPVSLLVVRIASALADSCPSIPGWSPWILFFVLGSLWYGFIGWLLKIFITWMSGKMHRDT
jgi:hypothetical protein